MRRWIVLGLVTLPLWSSSLNTLLDRLENTLLLQAKATQILAKKKLYQSKQGLNSPTFELNLETARLFTTPTITLHLPQPLAFPMGSKSFFEFEAKVSYPLFTGYAITSEIEHSHLELLKAKLSYKDLKRQLTLKLIAHYAQIYALLQQQKALQKAQEALEVALFKAKEFFKEQLIPKSDVANLEAKLYELKAKEKELDALLTSHQETLFYLTRQKVTNPSLPFFKLPKRMDFSQRADLLALEKELLQKKAEVELAKSLLYPKVGVEVAFKRFGNSLRFDGDGVRNADESYIGAKVKYLFHSGTKEKIEASQLAYLAKQQLLNDYRKKIKTEIITQKAKLSALKEKLLWAKKEYQAKKEYLLLTQEEFKVQLASGDRLSEAIAQVARAKAQVEGIKATIFAQKCKILLLHSYNQFQKIRSSW